jgi:phi LC3 family holin
MDKAKLYSRLSRPAFYIAMLGAIKLITDAFGYSLITNEQINAIANGVATLVTVIGVAVGWDG